MELSGKGLKKGTLPPHKFLSLWKCIVRRDMNRFRSFQVSTECKSNFKKTSSPFFWGLFLACCAAILSLVSFTLNALGEGEIMKKRIENTPNPPIFPPKPCRSLWNRGSGVYSVYSSIKSFRENIYFMSRITKHNEFWNLTTFEWNHFWWYSEIDPPLLYSNHVNIVCGQKKRIC